MTRKSRRRRIFPASLLVTLVTLALSRSPVLEQLYRGRRALQRRFRRRRERKITMPRPEVPLEEPHELAGGEESLLAQVENRFVRLANQTERRVDRWKNRLGARFGDEDQLKIVPYRGFGTPERLFLKGRVIEDEGVRPATEEDSIWRNLVNVYKRFESDEVPGMQVVARFQGQTYQTATNDEGFFEFWIEPGEPIPADRLWHEVDLELVDPLQVGEDPVHATGYVLVPPPSARFGVISDVDDTIVMTNATNVLKMARTVFFGNAYTRIPFEGVSAFYEALQAGATKREFNPLFYVSSSPWNLYGLLAEFLDIQDIPIGPLMLRDWGISNDEVLPTKHAPHKRKSIHRILDTFPDLPFILIGDSGQEDPEIYYEVVRSYPDRILAIYIRNVSHKPERPEAIRALALEVENVGSTLILTDDTLAAAQHAAAEGWIDPEMLPLIQVQVAVDETIDETDEEEAPTIVIEGDEQQGTRG